jgi:hypothetical protein
LSLTWRKALKDFVLAFCSHGAKGRHFPQPRGKPRKPEGPRNRADQPAIG